MHHRSLKTRTAWNIYWTRYSEEEGSAVFQNCTDTVRMYFTVREVFFTLYRPPYPPVAQLRGRRPLGPHTAASFYPPRPVGVGRRRRLDVVYYVPLNLITQTNIATVRMMWTRGAS